MKNPFIDEEGLPILGAWVAAFFIVLGIICAIASKYEPSRQEKAKRENDFRRESARQVTHGVIDALMERGIKIEKEKK